MIRKVAALGAASLLLVSSACARPSGGSADGSAGRTRAVVDTVPPETGSGGGGMMGGSGMMGRRGMGAMMGSSADTSAAPETTAASASAPGCPDVSQKLVDTGRRIFAGDGATCFACHGSDAHGTTLAPNLADSTWLDTDGSYAGIVRTVQSGVTHPKRFPAPMPPMGGAQLGSDQVCEVAAYVYSLSH